jgi:radical SAM superfamily enzyme YgiQ (UPF0313 family)
VRAANVALVSCQENADILGVKYLHAHLRALGHQSTILLVPARNERSVRAALAFLEQLAPEVVGISAMTYELAAARELAAACRTRLPRSLLVIGGAHATADPGSCLDLVDLVVRGEGEETLAAVLAAAGREPAGAVASRFEDVAGLAFRRGSELVLTPTRPPACDLDALPEPGHRPARMFVVHEGAAQPFEKPAVFRAYARYRGTYLSVLASRGCPFSCSYCANSVYRDLYGAGAMRRRSAEGVVREIEREVAACPGILYVNFADDCFLMNQPDWLAAFAAAYAARVGLPFIVRTTPRHVSAQKLALLRPAGLRWVFMGLQTGSDRVNREIYERNVTAREFLAAAQAVADHNLSPWYDVILDNPYESEAETRETIDVLLRAPRPFQLDLFSLDFFPGTRLRSRALREGRVLPEPGSKHYTKPEPRMINRYVRMSATLPPGVVRALLRVRRTAAGGALGRLAYAAALTLEPLMYLRLVFRSMDRSLPRTLRVLRAFAGNAFGKLYLRRLG